MESALIILLLTIFGKALSQSYSGDVTFYSEWRGNYGSCGLERSKTDYFYAAALSRSMMKLPPGMTNPNNHPKCAADVCLQVYGVRGSVVLKVSDTCWGCKDNDVYIADQIFPMLDDPNRGRVRMYWNFVICKTNPPGRK